jgi:cytochrome P450
MELPQLDFLGLRGPDHHAILAGARREGWLARTELGYVVLERDAASFFLRTRAATFPGRKIAELFGIEDGALREQIDRNILHIDGPDHRRLRNLVNPAFTPRAADRWRPVMRGFLDELHAAMPASGEIEFVDAVAKPYPALTIAALVGAPREDAPRLAEWSNWIQRQFDGPTLVAERDRVERACAEFYAWADGMLAHRRATPGDDLVSTLIAEEQDGDRLSDVELVNLVLNVLVGGVDTTQSQLAHLVRLLAQHPEQWDLVRADPEVQVPLAVEEATRYEPITPFTARITVEDVEYGGVTFPKDTIVLVAAATANRDGVEDGDRFDVTREPTKPLTFGAGIHYCLGVNLARAEMEEALTFLAARVARFELTGEPEYDTVQGVYGLVSLPVRLVPA